MYKTYKLEQDSIPDPLPSQPVDEPSMADKDDDIISRCWIEIERQCSSTHPIIEEKSDSGQGWKTVRLFVSSTFTDFFNEREILVKKVFPELREWCELRKISLIECDLRWGVPKDTTSRDTICTCLEEIDRCQQENGQPFFLNLLGDRYGWIPSENDVTDDVREKYNWVQNTSITFMEILTGAYRTLNPNAAFFIRSSDYLGDIPSDQEGRFVDKDTLKAKHLQELKRRLHERFPTQTFDYTCQVDTESLTDEEGTGKVAFLGLDEFADQVLEFFKHAIEKKYPEQQNVESLDKWQQERQLQLIFAKQKADQTIGREAVVSQLLDFARGEKPSNMEITEGGETEKEGGETEKDTKKFWSEYGDLHTNQSVISPPGFGKTSLMASVVMEAVKNGLDVFYHFVGCTSDSCTADNLLERLRRHIGDAEEMDTSEMKEDINITKMKKILSILKNREDHLLIVLDGVNQLLYRDKDSHLAWLPPGFPSKVRCVVSSATEHPASVNRLLLYPTYKLQLGEITPDTSRQIVTTSLGRFNKRLDPEQLELVLAHPCSHQPLWLVIICEELRVFGKFEKLTGKISALPATLDGLLEEIITRLVSEDQTQCMQKSLCLISTARSGLPVPDVLNLLGDLKTKEPAALVYWAQVRRCLKPFIRTVTSGATERVFFFHQAMEIAVRNKLVPGNEEKIQWNTHMADYVEFWCERKDTRRDELPDYLRGAGLKSRLVNFIRKSPEAKEIPEFTRRNYLQFCRCQNVVGERIPMTSPLMICMGCGMRSGHFSQGHFNNTQVCVICGKWAFDKFNKHPANICSWHSNMISSSSFMPKCYICKRIVKHDRNATQGTICQICYMDRQGRRCVLLDQL